MRKVKELMTSNPFACRSTQTLDKVQEFMKKGRIRHVPVLNEKGNVIGLLTHRDLLKACLTSFQVTSQESLNAFLKIKQIGEFMQTELVTTTPEIDLKDAASLMQQRKLGCLPVLEGGKLVGILTEADFLNLAWEVLNSNDTNGDAG